METYSVFLQAHCSEPIAFISFDAKNSSFTEILQGLNDSHFGFFPLTWSFKKSGNWLLFPSISSSKVRWLGKQEVELLFKVGMQKSKRPPRKFPVNNMALFITFQY